MKSIKSIIAQIFTRRSQPPEPIASMLEKMAVDHADKEEEKLRCGLGQEGCKIFAGFLERSGQQAFTCSGVTEWFYFDAKAICFHPNAVELINKLCDGIGILLKKSIPKERLIFAEQDSFTIEVRENEFRFHYRYVNMPTKRVTTKKQ